MTEYETALLRWDDCRKAVQAAQVNGNINAVFETEIAEWQARQTLDTVKANMGAAWMMGRRFAAEVYELDATAVAQDAEGMAARLIRLEKTVEQMATAIERMTAEYTAEVADLRQTIETIKARQDAIGRTAGGMPTRPVMQIRPTVSPF